MTLRVVVSSKILRLSVLTKRLTLAIGRFIGFVQKVEVVEVNSDARLTVDKAPQNIVSTANDVVVPVPFKNILNTIGIDDGEPYFFEDYIAEDYVLGRQIIKIFTKSPVETSTVALSKSILTLQQVFSDSILAIDDIDGELSDSDDILLEFFKATDNTPGMTDVSIISMSKVSLDFSSVSDTGLLRSQNYTEDMTYFAEDYVGESRAFS